MNLIWMIVAFGVTCGLMVIGLHVLFGRLRRASGTARSGPIVPESTVGGLGIGNLKPGAETLARAGQHAKARMTLNTVVMTPTVGLRIISLGGSALILFLLWGPYFAALSPGQPLQIAISIAIGYSVLFVAGYEARYDADGIKAPNWLFQEVFYPWEEFISIHDDGHYLYVLRFERAKLRMQKYLVGMPTFLTFVTDLREMNRRL